MPETITFRRISVDDFDAYFRLDSPGYFLIKEALDTGDEVGDALATLEAVCLANKLYDIEFMARMVDELKPHGKAEEYARNSLAPEGAQLAADLAIKTLGKDRVTQVMRDVMAYL